MRTIIGNFLKGTAFLGMGVGVLVALIAILKGVNEPVGRLGQEVILSGVGAGVGMVISFATLYWIIESVDVIARASALVEKKLLEPQAAVQPSADLRAA